MGELLWKEWTGEGYEPLHEYSVTFFTEDHIDLENELIRRALASALQRDGVAVGHRRYPDRLGAMDVD